MNAPLNALHGRVVSTMTGIRVKYWIPRLQQLVKRVRKRCYGCNRFQTVIFQTPPLVLLPRDHSECDKFFKLQVLTTLNLPFIKKQKTEGKDYALLFTCSLLGAVHIELLTDQTTEGFIQCLKRFVARKRGPQRIYSENVKTFEAAAKWLKKVMNSEKFYEYLISQEIK